MNDGQAFWRLSGAHRHLVERFRPRHATPAPWGEQEHTADGTGAHPRCQKGYGWVQVVNSCCTMTSLSPHGSLLAGVGSWAFSFGGSSLRGTVPLKDPQRQKAQLPTPAKRPQGPEV